MQIVDRQSKSYSFTIDRLNMKKRGRIDTITLEDGSSYTLEIDPSHSFATQSLQDEIDHPITLQPQTICPLYFPDNIEDGQILKIKVKGLSPDEALQLLQPLKAKLRIDVNQGWSYDETLYFLRHLNLTQVDFIEEPCANYTQLVQLSRHYPIALDESLADKVDITPFDTLVIKPFRLPHFIDYINSGKRIILSSNFDSEVGLNQIRRFAQRCNITEPLGIDTLKYCRCD